MVPPPLRHCHPPIPVPMGVRPSRRAPRASFAASTPLLPRCSRTAISTSVSGEPYQLRRIQGRDGHNGREPRYSGV